jgi:hypothetical protein
VPAVGVESSDLCYIECILKTREISLNRGDTVFGFPKSGLVKTADFTPTSSSHGDISLKSIVFHGLNSNFPCVHVSIHATEGHLRVKLSLSICLCTFVFSLTLFDSVRHLFGRIDMWKHLDGNEKSLVVSIIESPITFTALPRFAMTNYPSILRILSIPNDLPSAATLRNIFLCLTNEQQSIPDFIRDAQF